MHPSTSHLIQFFDHSHLPDHLAKISSKFAALAFEVATGPENPETTESVRKLLEAKDCAVRALIANTKE